MREIESQALGRKPKEQTHERKTQKRERAPTGERELFWLLQSKPNTKGKSFPYDSYFLKAVGFASSVQLQPNV